MMHTLIFVFEFATAIPMVLSNDVARLCCWCNLNDLSVCTEINCGVEQLFVDLRAELY